MRNRSTVVREHTKNEKAKDDKDEESKKQKMQKTMTDRFFCQRQDIILESMTWASSAKMDFGRKCLSVLIGNPSADWSSSVLNAREFRKAIIGLLAVTVLLTVKNEYLTYEDIYKVMHVKK